MAVEEPSFDRQPTPDTEPNIRDERPFFGEPSPGPDEDSETGPQRRRLSQVSSPLLARKRNTLAQDMNMTTYIADRANLSRLPGDLQLRG